MPPGSAAVTLSPKQIDTLRQWIKEGAKWEKHWAFIAPERPAYGVALRSVQPDWLPLVDDAPA